MAVSLEVESWLWYSVAITAVILRMVSRAKSLGGYRQLQIEDLLMTIALAFYTSEIVFMNIVASAQSNLLPPGYLKHHVLTKQEISRRAYGSKITLVVEQCQCSTIWLMKICILLMYYRLTELPYPKHNKAVVVLGVYVIASFLLMEGFYFGLWCQPFDEYWAVPTSNPKQCAAAWNHLITNMVFNLTSDIAMIGIASSLVLWYNFSPQNKLALSALIALGGFVVASAIANKAYSFSNPYGSEWTKWYIREASTATLVANLPYVWSLGQGYVLRWNEKIRGASTSSYNSNHDINNGDATGGHSSIHRNLTRHENTSRPLSWSGNILGPAHGSRNTGVLGKEDELALRLEKWETLDSASSSRRPSSPYPRTPEPPALSLRQPRQYPETPDRSRPSTRKHPSNPETPERPSPSPRPRVETSESARDGLQPSPELLSPSRYRKSEADRSRRDSPHPSNTSRSPSLVRRQISEMWGESAATSRPQPPEISKSPSTSHEHPSLDRHPSWVFHERADALSGPRPPRPARSDHLFGTIQRGTSDYELFPRLAKPSKNDPESQTSAGESEPVVGHMQHGDLLPEFPWAEKLNPATELTKSF